MWQPSDSVIVAVVAAFSSYIIARVNKTHDAVNSKMTELLRVTRSLAIKEGILKEKDFQRDQEALRVAAEAEDTAHKSD